jgi:hypothetical protein
LPGRRHAQAPRLKSARSKADMILVVRSAEYTPGRVAWAEANVSFVVCEIR